MRLNVSFADWTLVAGIDPGTRIIGAALLAVRGQDLQVADVRSWKVEGATIEDRVNFVGESIELWLPEGVRLTGVENGYVGKNARSALTIAMARGAAVRAARRRGGAAQLVDPQEARKAIGAARWGAKRREAKDRVQRTVRTLLNLRSPPDEDEADACALAVWASNRVWKLDR